MAPSKATPEDSSVPVQLEVLDEDLDRARSSAREEDPPYVRRLQVQLAQIFCGSFSLDKCICSSNVLIVVTCQSQCYASSAPPTF